MSKIAFPTHLILGHVVTDNVTKLKGVCTGVAEFFYGEARCAVTPTAMKDGVPQDMIWMDPPRLKIGKLNTKPGAYKINVALGSVVTDKMTGFTGIATGRYTYLNGCVRVEITPKKLKDGVPIEPALFDEQRITGLEDGTGGPAPSNRYPTVKRA